MKLRARGPEDWLATGVTTSQSRARPRGDRERIDLLLDELSAVMDERARLRAEVVKLRAEVAQLRSRQHSQ